MLQNNPKLKSLIDKLWNRFWSGGISNPLTAIEQITYLIFMKRLDELDTKREQDAEWSNEVFKSRFEGIWLSGWNHKSDEDREKSYSEEEIKGPDFEAVYLKKMLRLTVVFIVPN